MEGKAFVIMVLTGLCALPSCFPRQYHLVEELKNWTEAQSYCREKFTDLATVDNQEDMAKLHDITGRYHNGHVWIGLYDDINSWRWSLENKSYYGKGEAEFRMWASTKPSNLFTKTCAGMGTDAAWWDGRCNATFPFICYNGAIAAQDSSRFIFVNKSKTWTKAQSYCRERYTDLASVRNQAENDEIKTIIPQGTDAWIGLFRDSWKWSDGSATSITNWNTKNSEPKDNITEACGMSRVGKWETWLCSHRLFFVCYSENTYP
uniref:putative C-type lectin domain family 20 member A n=1 Tax=Centroberyx gerrardi TaxID=166262 RepID=UPI003AAE14F2